MYGIAEKKKRKMINEKNIKNKHDKKGKKYVSMT